MSFPLITVKDIQLPDNIRKVESLEDAAGVFDGFGGALADILPNVALSTGSNATTAYFGTFGTGQIEAAAAEARELGLIDQDPQEFAEEQRARAEDVAKEWRRLAREKYTPDPYTTGIAGQIVHGVGTEIAKGLAASALALGNPAGAAVLYGTQHGIETYDKYRDKGVDDETAMNAGIAAFAAGTIGMALPAAYGPTRLRSAIYGAVVNPAANVSEELVTRMVLDNAGYTKIASEIDPFDPVNLLTAAVIGGGFGAIGFRAGERASRAADAPRAADNASGATEAALAAESAPAPRQTAAAPVPESAASPAREGAPRAEMSSPAQTAEPRAGSVESVDVSEVRRASTMRQSESGVMLQNRNRGTFSSRAQMQAIAAAPDYDRVSVSRDFAQGAPVVAYVSDLPAGQVGRVERVTASDGSKMTMRYAVMEADSILTSNRADGSRVEEYGATDWHVTIAGNGRVAGITEAYRRGTAAQYKADLVADAEAVGIAPQVIEGMEKPVLVRLMSDKDAARPDIAQLSNESGTKALDATEQAENDAASIDVAALAFDEEGNITPEAVTQFAAMIPDNSSILDQGGVPNSLARPRLERAIFQRVYGRPYLTSLLTDTEGGGRIVQVLMRLAPKMMQLEEAGDLDFRNALVGAATEIYEMRASGSKASLRELAAQRPLGRTPETQAFLTYFSENSGKVLEPVRVFSELADWASANRYDPTSMFADETPQATRADLLAEFGDLAGVPVDPQLVALVQSDVTREQKIEKVRAKISEQLTETGMDADQVDAQATLWTGAVMRFAEQSGVEPLDILPKIKVSEEVDERGFRWTEVARTRLLEEVRGWGRVIDSLESKPTQWVRMLTQTPLAMKLVGADFAELRAHPHLFDGIFSEAKKSSPNHNTHVAMTREVLKQIPQSLTDPVAVFKDDRRPNSFVFMLDMVDSAGDTVIVPIEFNANGRVATVNLVKTAYGKERKLWFPLQEQQNLLVYANSEKIRRWNTSSGSNSLRGSNADGSRVYNENDLVNLQRQYPDFYQARDNFQLDQEGSSSGSYSPTENRIKLTPNANITTFSHEMGHWWLETAIRLTKNSETNLELRRDVRKLFDLWGVKSHADWDALGTEGQRRFHEQFASWVEEYLSTGRPPAPQLQSLFEKFRAWITDLYRDFRAHLNERYRSEFGEELPELSREVRDILDRNLAYEDALTQARREFAPSQVSADAARYASYQRTVLADQPVDHGDAQQVQSSLFAEADALAALDRGEQVSVSAPVDADWANGEVQRIRGELHLPESILPREPETDLPVYEAPQRMTAVEQAENLAGQNQAAEASLDEGPGLFDMEEDGGEAPSPAAQQRPAPAADLGAMADDAHLAKRAQELAERSPDMPVGITGIGKEIENLTVGDLLARAENEAADIERMADILSPAAECILRNGGI